MNEKHLLIAGVVSLAFIALSCTMAEIVSSPPNTGAATTISPNPLVRPSSVPASENPFPSSAPTPVVVKMVVPPPAPLTSSVQDSDLKHLASMVHLDLAKQQVPDKTQWKQAIPVAQGLLLGTCDCEQRNWLKQFVTMGDYALANSKDYYQSAQLMDKLPLNDQELNRHYNSK